MINLHCGRGGSPLQNLIQNGHRSAMITALCWGTDLVKGDINLMQHLSLHDTAEEILLRVERLIEEKIALIVRKEPTPGPQKVETVVLSQRKPFQSNLDMCRECNLNSSYDKSSMLGAWREPLLISKNYCLWLELQRGCQSFDGNHADVKMMPIASIGTPKI